MRCIERRLYDLPEADGVDEFSQCFIISGEDVFHRTAVGSELLHSCWRHLVFCLTRQHERNQYLETPHLQRQRREQNSSKQVCYVNVNHTTETRLQAQGLLCRSISPPPCYLQVHRGCFSSLECAPVVSSSPAVPSALPSSVEHCRPDRSPPSGASSSGCVKIEVEHLFLFLGVSPRVGAVQGDHLNEHWGQKNTRPEAMWHLYSKFTEVLLKPLHTFTSCCPEMNKVSS